MAFYSTEATRRAQNIKMMSDMLSTYLDEKSEERKLYATTPDTKLYEYWDPQTQSYRRGTRDVASRYAVKAPEEPKRPYKVGELVERTTSPTEETTFQVTGYDDANMPVMAEVPDTKRDIWKPAPALTPEEAATAAEKKELRESEKALAGKLGMSVTDWNFAKNITMAIRNPTLSPDQSNELKRLAGEYGEIQDPSSAQVNTFQTKLDDIMAYEKPDKGFAPAYKVGQIDYFKRNDGKTVEGIYQGEEYISTSKDIEYNMAPGWKFHEETDTFKPEKDKTYFKQDANGKWQLYTITGGVAVETGNPVGDADLPPEAELTKVFDEETNSYVMVEKKEGLVVGAAKPLTYKTWYGDDNEEYTVETNPNTGARIWVKAPPGINNDTPVTSDQLRALSQTKPDKITPGKIETFWKNGEPRTTIWKDGVRVWQDSGEPATNEELAKYTQKKADKPKVSTTEIWYDKISGDAITIEVRGDGRYYAGTDDKITGVELQTLTKAKPEGKKASTYRTAWDKNTGERIDIEIKQDGFEYNMATDNPITPDEKMNMTMTKPEDKMTKRWKDAANALKILNYAKDYGEGEARELYGAEAVDEHFPDGFPTSQEEIDAGIKAREERIKNAAKSIITTTKNLSQDERNKYFRMIESKEKPKAETRIKLMEADAKIIRSTFLQRRPNSEVSVYPSIQEFFDVTNAQLAALNKRNPQNPPLPLLSSLDQAKEFIKKTFSEYQSGKGNAIIYIHSDPLPLRSFGMIDTFIAEAVLSGLEG
jgi:hypothetical protein